MKSLFHSAPLSLSLMIDKASFSPLQKGPLFWFLNRYWQRPGAGVGPAWAQVKALEVPASP